MPEYFDFEAEQLQTIAKRESVQSFAPIARSFLAGSGLYDDDELTDYADIEAASEGGNDIDDDMSEFGEERQWVEATPDFNASRQTARAIGSQRAGAAVQPSGLQPAYQVEKDDSRHRMGQILDLIFNNYYLDQFGTRLDAPPFFKWLDDLSYFQIVAMLRTMGWSEANIRTTAPTLMTGVTYLSRAARRNYRVAIQQGTLVWRGRPLDTSALSTVFSGRGWGIWVMSPKKRFYTNSHLKGLFHHSSFLRGGKVIAGGEWKATAGRLEYITGKTGHYATDAEALAACVQRLVSSGVNVSQTQVGVYRNYGQDVDLMSVDDFLSTDRKGVATFGAQPVIPRQAEPARRPMLGAHRRG